MQKLVRDCMDRIGGSMAVLATLGYVLYTLTG